jgi:hypothetical protein
LAGFSAEPPREVVWVVKAGACGGVGDRWLRTQGGLRDFKAELITHRPESEPGFPFQFPVKVIRVVAGGASNFGE